MKAYYVAEADEDGVFTSDGVGKLLVGPDGFECYLGEPEDCSWYRDGGRVVAELNRLYELVQELQKEQRN